LKIKKKNKKKRNFLKIREKVAADVFFEKFDKLFIGLKINKYKIR